MKNCELAEFGILRTRHADRAALERLVGELGRQVGLVRTAHAGGAGVVAVVHVAILHVAGLRHEAFDDAVEGDVVVGAFAGQRLDLLDMLRREVGPQRNRHVAVLQRDDQRILRICGEGELGCEQCRGHDARRSEPFQHELSPEPYLDLNFALSGATTAAGTKGRMSPPIDAIWRTSVAVMVRTEGLAGRKTVCSSGAIVSFMPAICIS